MATADAAPLRVVVADDSPESRALLRAMLDPVDGVEVVGAAADGRQAVELVGQQHPDLILLDIAMPVMDGLEAAAAIRANSPEMKIAMYSAYNRAKMGPAAIAAGADEYVEKAATTAELLDQIHRLFPDRAAPELRPPGHGSPRPAESGTVRTTGEQRYRLLLDALEEGVLTTDAAGLVTDSNFVATRILQVPVSRMVGRPLRELGLAADIVENAMRSQRPASNVDYTLTRPDGTTRSLLISVRPLHDPAGLAVHETLVSFVDLTTQKLAEQKLAAAEARLRATFDAMLEGLATLCAVRDEGGQIVDFRYELVNDEGCRLNLMRRDQLVGHLLCEVLPGHRESGLFDEYVQVTETRQPLQKTSLSVQDEWGTGRSMTRVFDVRAVASGDGLAAGWREVTDDVRAHDALADSERRYRQMLEATQEGVSVSDDDGMTTYVNPRMSAMLGYTVEEMIGTPVWTLISNESTPAAEAGLEACRAGVAGTYQLQLCRKDGSTLWAVVTASPITDSQGNYTGALVMITDITEKRRTEEHLAHMTDLLTRTQEVSKTGGWEYDIATGRLVWTDEVYRIYGVDKIYDPNDITADIAAYDADSAPIMEAAFQRLVAEGEPYDLDLGLIRGDGQHIWVRTIGRPVIENGRVVRVGGNIVDITDRKRAEQALAASERRLRESFDSMLDGQAILSAVRARDGSITDFRFDYVNDVGCRLTGLPRERLIGQLLCVVQPFNRESGLFDEYVHAVETARTLDKHAVPVTGEWSHGHPSTRAFDFRAVPTRDGLMLTWRDVTDQVAAEQERMESQERLRSAVESLKEGFFLTRARRDEAGAITDLEYVIVNEAACQLTGRTEQDLVGRGYLEVWPVPPDGLFDAYRAVVETGVPYRTVVTSNAAEFTGTFEVSVTKVGDGCVFVVSEVSERLRHEQQLIDAHAEVASRAEQLQRSNRDLEAFASALSHDLREPLRTTAGFIQLIDDRYATSLPEPARELFGYVMDGTQRMNDRITAILNFARSGASAAPPHPVDSAAAAAAAAHDSDALLTANGAHLQIGPLPTVAADALQLQRVFQNLLSNAANYHNPGATPHININAERLDGRWQFTVADDGPGVPANQRQRIFAMFIRGTTGDDHDGHGMGLALCRRIIENYEGGIRVEDNPGGGSRFRFTLPATSP